MGFPLKGLFTLIYDTSCKNNRKRISHYRTYICWLFASFLLFTLVVYFYKLLLGQLFFFFSYAILVYSFYY